MTSRVRLSNYHIQVSNNGNTVILVSGSKLYYDLLADAFPDFRFSPAWPDQFNRYDWGFYINNIGDSERAQVRLLLELFQTTVCIDDRVPPTFALDYHYLPSYNAGRTEIGELVYQSKYQRNLSMAQQLASKFENFVACHLAYRKSDLLIATPPSNPKKPFDLPTFIVEQLCSRLKLTNGSHLVRKVKSTKPMKDASPEEKFENILGAFAVTQANKLKGKNVTVIDDIYYSGTTMLELISTLSQAGARVQGLVASKAKRLND
jgi:predicted amidophosphoribosyltransferase